MPHFPMHGTTDCLHMFFTAISVLAHFILISKIKILFHVKYFTLPITKDSAAEIGTVSANR